MSDNMRSAEIYCNGILAGVLTEENRKSYVFRYEDRYFNDSAMPSISLTFPKSRQEYQSEYLFPFFFNMLSEGVNKKLQNIQLKIDENDDFGLLLAIARFDTPGTVTVKPVRQK
jgi:HipA-like protein